MTVPGKGGAETLEDMRKYQLHCPECGREFLWDLDINEKKKRKIDRKKAEYEGMIADMKKHNDPMVLVWSQEYKGLQARLEEIKREEEQLNLVSERNEHYIVMTIFDEMQEAIRERLGDQGLYEFMDGMKSRLKPECIEFMMKKGRR